MTADDDAHDDFQLRDANKSDADAVVGLWEACGLTRWWNDPRADFAGFVEHANARVLLGESGGEAVAAVAVGHDGHRGWMYYLSVHPNCRGRGYARQLVRATEIWLNEQRIAKAQLMVRGENQDARGFYDALGYELQSVGVLGRWLSPRGVAPDTPAQPDDEGKLDVIITYLEMTAPPAEPPPHAPAGKRVALMRAEPPTVGFYRFLYDTIGANWLWWERRALDDAALKRVISHERVEIYVLYCDGTPAGMAELDRRQGERIELAYLGVMPEFLRQGLGRYLLGAAIEIAWSHHPERVTVNTCTLDHPKALSLYQRFGFEPVEREERRIDDPRLTGIIPAF